MPCVDSKHNHTWRLRLKLLSAMERTTPKVFLSLRDGLPHMPSPIEQVIPALRLQSAFEIERKVGGWDKWPPTLWAKRPYDSMVHALEVIDAWATYWNMGTDREVRVTISGVERVERRNWFKNYALKLCSYWCTRPDLRESLELMPVQDLEFAPELSLPTNPPHWVPGGVWMHDPDTYEQWRQETYLALENLDPTPGTQTNIKAHEQVFVPTLEEFLKKLKRWGEIAEERATQLGWVEEHEMRNLAQFDWLALRLFGSAGPMQIKRLTQANKCSNSIHDAVNKLARRLDLELPDASRKRAMAHIALRVGFKKRGKGTASTPESPDPSRHRAMA